MSAWLGWGLLLVFGVHLVAFALLWWRRRQGYYVALVITFALLTASTGLRLWGEAPVVANQPLDQWLRYGAWVAAAVSLSWTLARIWRRLQAG